MEELRITGYRPVQSPQAAAAAAPAPQEAAEAALPRTDSSAVTGQAYAGQPMSAEAALALLHETGLVESASRPVFPAAEELAGTAVTVTVDLPGDAAGQAVPAQEWRPYLPPALAAAALALPSDGKSLVLRLFAALDGGEGGLLKLGESSVPLDPGGRALAEFRDGSFRRLSFHPAALARQLAQGSVRAEIPRPEAQTRAANAAPRGESAAPRATAETAAGERPRLSPAPEPPLRLPPLEEKPGGALVWVLERSVARSFRQLETAWLSDAEQRDPVSPEARAELTEQRQAWAENLAREDPPAFRAWLEIAAKPALEQGGETAELLPEGFDRADYARWMSPPVRAYAAERAPERLREDGGWLANLLEKLFPAKQDPRTGALLRYLTGISPPEADNGAELTRRLSELLSQIERGTPIFRTAEQAADLSFPSEPQPREGELDRAWKRRRIAYEVDLAWTQNLKQWLLDVDGRSLGECRRYVNGKTDAWTTGLMEGQPAFFRQWLVSPARAAASAGEFNAAAGAFPIDTLPSGFTEEDLRRWLRFDVLDFL